MNRFFGWTGKIIRVDLSELKITYLQTMDYADRFLGGLGIGEYLYWTESSPELDAFHPDMPLILMTGPLAATPVPSASRTVVCGKSPCIYPETFASASIGGFFAAELKKAGFDGVVIKGKAPYPLYLAIENDNVELKDAREWWGLTNRQTRQAISAEIGIHTRVLSIGPGAENRTRIGTIQGAD